MEVPRMILEFFQGLRDFHFLQNALITAIVIGIVAGAVGCFIILRGMSLMGDAISHAVLPGVALSYILGINFFIGAITFGLLASIIITYIKGNSIIKSDTAIGITFSSFLALGVILIGVANSSTDLFHILFGNNHHPLFQAAIDYLLWPPAGSSHGHAGQLLSLSADDSLDLGLCDSYAERGNHSDSRSLDNAGSNGLPLCQQSENYDSAVLGFGSSGFCTGTLYRLQL